MDPTVTRQMALVPMPTGQESGLQAAQVASLKTGFILAVLGGVTNLGLLGYALYSFGANNRKRGLAALGGAGVAFLLTRKALTGALGIYKSMRGFQP